MNNKWFIDRDTKKKLYLEASKYCIDVSKLIFGGLILTGIIGLTEDKWLLLLCGGVGVVFLAVLGFGFVVLGNKKR